MLTMELQNLLDLNRTISTPDFDLGSKEQNIARAFLTMTATDLTAGFTGTLETLFKRLRLPGDITPRFFETTLRKLKRLKIIESKRGRFPRYRLAPELIARAGVRLQSCAQKSVGLTAGLTAETKSPPIKEKKDKKSFDNYIYTPPESPPGGSKIKDAIASLPVFEKLHSAYKDVLALIPGTLLKYFYHHRKVINWWLHKSYAGLDYIKYLVRMSMRPEIRKPACYFAAGLINYYADYMNSPEYQAADDRNKAKAAVKAFLADPKSDPAPILPDPATDPAETDPPADSGDQPKTPTSADLRPDPAPLGTAPAAAENPDPDPIQTPPETDPTPEDFLAEISRLAETIPPGQTPAPDLSVHAETIKTGWKYPHLRRRLLWLLDDITTRPAEDILRAFRTTADSIRRRLQKQLAP